MKFTGAPTLVLLFVVRASGQCWQARSFSESVVIPELRSSSVLHVPHVLSLAQCVQACCGLQGCDLAWFFDRRCFVLSCQHKGNCQPKQRPGADSFLVFLQRRPPQTLVLQSIVQGDSYPKPWQPLPRHRGSEDPRKDLDFLEDFQDVDNNNYAESLPSLEEKGGESTDLGLGKEPGLYNWPLNRDEFNQSETFVGQMTTPLSRLESSTLSLSEEKSESSMEKAEPTRTVTKLLTIDTKVEEEPQNISTDSLVLKGITTETLELSTVSVFATSPTSMALEEPGVVVSIKAPGNLTMLENTSELIGSVSPDNTSEVMVNKPPKAILLPKSQDVVLHEGSIVTINGSQSVDDSKITHYLWEKVDGPFWDPDGSVDTPILQLKKLLPGQYTFKLTVSDSEGLTDSSTALVSVRRPKDEPPQARAGTDQVITLPLNRLSLQGNRSTDDNSITSFLWTLLPSSHNQEVTMQNVRSPVLELSDLEEGQYTFQLAVTDDKGQQDFDTVTVTVLPANKPPVARTGPDRELLLPVSSFTLNGSDSTDDQAISTYQWDFLSGPPGVKIKDANNPVAIVTGLSAGNYKFKLTVTDQQGQTDSAVLSVAAKEAQNLPLVAHASGSHTLTLPNNSLVLRGSVSNSETSNVSFLWVRDEQSPAAGDVLYSSDHEALLYLANLVEGTYLFQLRVTDAQGRSSMATATVEVRPDPREQEEVDVELQVGVSRISRQQKDTVLRQLAALLHVMDSEIALKGLHKQSDISTVFRFSVLSPDGIIPGPKLARLLRNQLLREKTDFLLFKVLRVDTVACVLLCSGRGQCDPITRTCSCDPLWTENPIHRFFDGENNCDWNVMYVTISCLLTIVFFLSVSWVCVCCCKRGRRSKVRKKTKYTVLDSMDEQERMELRPKYNIKHRSTEHNSSLMMSESEMDSEQDGVFIPARGDKARIRVAGALRNCDALSLRHV